MTVTPPVTCFHMARVLVHGERLQLTPLTMLDLMRTDGSLSVEWHIKQLCHRSAIEFYAKPGLVLYLEMTFQSSLEVLQMQSQVKLNFSTFRCRECFMSLTHRDTYVRMKSYKHTHTPSYTHITPKKFNYRIRHMFFKYRLVIKVLTQKANTALHIPLANTNT